MSESQRNMVENKTMSQRYKIKTATLWDLVKSICTIIFVAVCGYKIVTVKTDLTIDFPTLLSLVLAFFSILISALFYFKATESSNLFYDNTYKFTKDISELLAKIESGFGEKLRNIDENNSKWQDRIFDYLPPQGTPEEINKKKEEVEDAKAELKEFVKETFKKESGNSAKADEFLVRIEQLSAALREKEREIEELKVFPDEGPFFIQFAKDLAKKISFSRYSKSKAYFRQSIKTMPEEFIAALILRGYADSEGELTKSGFMFFRKLDKKSIITSDSGINNWIDS
ncbi:hypothetical protein D0S45_02395 [Marinifilum sp. JC120]|nr:hypothetical protein D0S45_02395 [Marinifilum sp. JC120]